MRWGRIGRVRFLHQKSHHRLTAAFGYSRQPGDVHAGSNLKTGFYRYGPISAAALSVNGQIAADPFQVVLIFSGSVKSIAVIDQFDMVLFDPVSQPDVAQRRNILHTTNDKLLGAGAIAAFAKAIDKIVHIPGMPGLCYNHVVRIFQYTGAVFRIIQNRIVFGFHF